MRQKRQALGMVQASDRPKLRNVDFRPGSAAFKTKELHGNAIIKKKIWLKIFNKLQF